MVNNLLKNQIIDNQKINSFNIFISRHREDFFFAVLITDLTI